MGLQLPISYKGMQIEQAYAKIVAIEGNKNRLFFNVEFYVNKDISDADINNQMFLEIKGPFMIVPDLESSENFIKQMYLHLKTLDMFQNALDA